MQTHSFTGETAAAPCFPSALHSAIQHSPVHRASHGHTNICTSWGQDGSAPAKWLQQVRTRCEGAQQVREEQTTLLGCTLLSHSGNGTVISGFRWVAEEPLHQGYHRLFPKPTEVKGSICAYFSGP